MSIVICRGRKSSTKLEIALWSREASKTDINNSAIIEISPNPLGANVIINTGTDSGPIVPEEEVLLHNSSLTYIDSSEIYDLVESIDTFIAKTGRPPEMLPRKMSEYITGIKLVRDSDNEFAVFNWYLNTIEEIPEIGYTFKKK